MDDSTTYSLSPIVYRLRLRSVLLQLGLDVRLWYRANDLVDHLAILEEQQQRDRAHVEACRGLDVGVHVELRDFHLALIVCRELVEDWRDHPARTTPGRPE